MNIRKFHFPAPISRTQSDQTILISRKINIWAGFVILSPYFGPLFTAFILSVTKWNWGFWLLTMLTGLCLVCIILFVDETYYNRRIPASERPMPHSRIKRLIGIEQWHSRKQRSTFWQAFMRPWQVIAKPTVLLSMTYYMFSFAWVVGINTTLSIFLTPLYNFGLRQIGMSPQYLLTLNYRYSIS